MSNNNPRSMAQDAARWYLTNLDPYRSNESNIQILRQPLVALTAKTLQTRPLDLPNDNSVTSSEEKKCAADRSGDWREYLQEETVGNNDINGNEQILLKKEEYASLSRRTKARMEAFLAGCSLTVPGPEDESSKSIGRDISNERKKSTTKNSMISLQDGLSGFGFEQKIPKPSKHLRVPSNTEKMGRMMIGETADPNRVKHDQIARDDLVVRLELYIRALQRIRNLNEECVIAMETPKLIRARARYTTNSFIATANYVRNVNPVLTRLLHCLTMEMLAVECVSEETTKVIHRVVSEYEHRTSFASLAFLSTPEVNADSVLTPLIIKFLRHLQADWERLVMECELERMLIRAVDPSMRKMFKTVEFQSIGHLLEVCHIHRKQLQCIELPPNVCATAENVGSLCNNPDAVRQALRDLRREIITVNGHVLPPVTSRKELVSMLTQTLNSRTLTAPSPEKRRSSTRKNATSGRSFRDRKSPPLENDSELSSDGASSPIEKEVISDISENESSILSNSECDSSLAMDSPNENARIKKLSSSSSSRRRRNGKFHLSTIDVLTRRLLIAASRTGNGGDAYFFV